MIWSLRIYIVTFDCLLLVFIRRWGLLVMQNLIKEHKWNIRLTCTQTSAVSEHAHSTGRYPLWDEVKFIDRDPHWYTCRVKEVIHIRLHPHNINRDSGIKIPEGWMPTIKKHNNRKAAKKWTTEGRTHWNSKDGNAPNTAVETSQSQQSIVLYKVSRNQSTSSPDED